MFKVNLGALIAGVSLMGGLTLQPAYAEEAKASDSKAGSDAKPVDDQSTDASGAEIIVTARRRNGRQGEYRLPESSA
ncbi:hypothetical protein F9288_05985 [Sphingomonas sp. CL5.1]|uniref:hypothetical protein n=1 Tax=Sphingomonas sp. CL5.1 TaxID=2653203 RepID=UPI0015834638|nr:hypothetical protein [Sphingomonas sp. CL5.1]QKR99251.1 hypothetical protein F9288_05985 [Sphingomonas sp. CL5.1]